MVYVMQVVWLSVEDGRLFHTATVNHSPSSELAVDINPDEDTLLVGSSSGILSLIRVTKLQSEVKAVASNPNPNPGSQRQARRRGGESSEATPAKLELKLESEVLDLTNAHAGPITGVRVMDGTRLSPSLAPSA
jgi:hypothetical protein